MFFKVDHLLAIYIITHYRVAYTVKIVFSILRLPDCLVGFLHTLHLKSVNFIIMYYRIFGEFNVGMNIYCFKYTSRSGDGNFS